MSGHLNMNSSYYGIKNVSEDRSFLSNPALQVKVSEQMRSPPNLFTGVTLR